MDSISGNYDVIAIGGASRRLSAAYHLGKRNARTLVLQQFTFANQPGSSAGLSRPFRYPCTEKYLVKILVPLLPQKSLNSPYPTWFVFQPPARR